MFWSLEGRGGCQPNSPLLLNVLSLTWLFIAVSDRFEFHLLIDEDLWYLYA